MSKNTDTENEDQVATTAHLHHDQLNELIKELATRNDDTTEPVFNFAGFDKDGYDEKGFNCDGINRDGVARFTHTQNNDYTQDNETPEMINEEEIALDNHDKINAMFGNQTGYDEDGYDANGYNFSGYNREGYDGEGFNCDGINKDGVARFTHAQNNDDAQDNETPALIGLDEVV